MMRLEPKEADILLHVENRKPVLRLKQSDEQIQNLKLQIKESGEKISAINMMKSSSARRAIHLKSTVSNLQSRGSSLSSTITSRMLSGQDYSELMAELKQVNEEIEKLEQEALEIENSDYNRCLDETRQQQDKLYSQLGAIESRLTEMRRNVPNSYFSSKSTICTDAENAVRLLELATDAEITPAFANLLLEQIERKSKRIGSLDLENPTYDLSYKIAPFHHQKIGYMVGMTYPNSGLLWEMGTGKTRCAIDIIRKRFELCNIDKAIVVCPPTIADNWMQEIRLFGEGLQGIMLRGSKKDKIRALRGKEHIAIISYMSLYRIIDDVVDAISGMRVMAICDESSKIKNVSASSSIGCHKLGRECDYKLIISGTPITQHAHDAFSQFLFLDSGETFGDNYDRFISKYFVKDGWNYRISRENLDAISNKIFKTCTRFLKKDCADLPNKSYVMRSVEMSKEHREIYDEMLKKCIIELENEEKVTALIVLTKLLRLSQITSGFVSTVSGQEKEVGTAKIDALRDVIEEIGSAQFIVWGRFKHDIRLVSKTLDEMNVSHGLLYGDTDFNSRQQAIDDFQAGKLQCIVGNQQTGGMGINLTAASISIYYSNDYSYSNRIQSEDRCHRIGQKKNVTYIDLVCNDTIDLKVLQILKSKRNIADIVTKDAIRWMQDQMNDGGFIKLLKEL